MSCRKNVSNTKMYFESFIENLIHAVKRVRDGDSYGAHMCLNGSLIHGSRVTMGDHSERSELPKGVNVDTAIYDIAYFSCGELSAEDVEHLVAYVAQPARGNFRDLIDKAFREMNVRPIEGSVKELMERANMSRKAS